MRRRIPLAWLQLSHDRRRLLAAVGGIGFAVVLMMMQLAFRDSLYTSLTRIPDHLVADIVLINRQYEYMVEPKTFSQRRLYQALAVPGVKSVAPLYLRMISLKHPVTHSEYVIMVLGFNPAQEVLNLPGLSQNQQLIKEPDVALFDADSRPVYGPIEDMLRSTRLTTEINGRKIEIAGLFHLGSSFGSNGHLVTSDQTFLRMVTPRKQSLINLGLIKLDAGVDAEQVCAHLRTILPEDVEVLTRKAFIKRERDYWTANAPIGFIFNLGALMGIIVGVVFVYQILYTDVTDHLSEYATLKAMGHTDRYLCGIVAREAIILSVLGSIPGMAIAQGLYVFAKHATRLPIEMTFERFVVVVLLTMGMCITSAILAVRKLRRADPAEMFSIV